MHREESRFPVPEPRFRRLFDREIPTLSMSGWLFDASDWFERTVKSLDGNVKLPILAHLETDLDLDAGNFVGLTAVIGPPDDSGDCALAIQSGARPADRWGSVLSVDDMSSGDFLANYTLLDDLFEHLPQIQKTVEFECTSTLILPSAEFEPVVALPFRLLPNTNTPLSDLVGIRFKIDVAGLRGAFMSFDVIDDLLRAQVQFDRRVAPNLRAVTLASEKLHRLYSATIVRRADMGDEQDGLE